MVAGIPEILIILVIVAVFFGAGKLPDVMGSIGKAAKEFRDAQADPDGDRARDAEGSGEAPADDERPPPT